MAQEHQEYIQQKVNPILENLVTQLLLERPEQLAPFMIKWLSQNSKTPAAAALTEGVTVLSGLKSELEKLQEDVKNLEMEVDKKAGPLKATKREIIKDDESEEEEDDEDDGDDLPPPPPPSYMNRGPRASVSAEAYGAFNQMKQFTAPVYPKTDEQNARIRNVLKESFLFSSLDPKELGTVIGAMQEKIVQKDTRLIQQGDDGDCLYVVEEGQLDCFKKIENEEKKVKECKAGDAFGELALLYNCPRAASVVAQTKCVLWQLDRESFNHIVKQAASKRRERYEDFLKSIPILQTMEAYERGVMCDALQPVTAMKDDVIIKQGDVGDRFYIIEEGTARVDKVYVPGTPAQQVLEYSTGDYFGELALLTNEPRAATVTATTELRLLALSRRTFSDLLGPLEAILRRKAGEYK
eukprot:TRINITY_DN78546_c0_g1_i1.p1 TRINITY_DN78546_c0_g1~~TRINITY_DN78546_c0_g1_i1.p1  ORF type:complete len:410 (-),score=116.09 TRINITY_DN78546_c0_g1_i1:46-1275(-)